MKRRRIIIAFLLGLLGFAFGFFLTSKQTINEFGLNTLQTLKEWRGQAVALDQINKNGATVPQHEQWDRLLSRHVTKEGLVNYHGFQKDDPLLKSYLRELSINPPNDTWSSADQLAYWMNAYNAFTIQLILDYYPINSIKDIAGNLPMINTPWDLKFFQIGGVDFDLNTIEHVIIRKQFEEPRIHFAINCASISCPVLRAEAYKGPLLEQQLQEQTIQFLNDSTKNQFTEKEWKVSRLFSWFKEDFTKEQTLFDFLEEYVPIQGKSTIKISYLPYDWGLNEN